MKARQKPFAVKSKVWIEQEGNLVLGPGRAHLLKLVEQTGSINAAAKELGMSYRHAWSIINAVEKRLGYPLLIRQRGGSCGGGARLTAAAMELIRTYDDLNHRVTAFTDRIAGKVLRDEKTRTT